MCQQQLLASAASAAAGMAAKLSVSQHQHNPRVLKLQMQRVQCCHLLIKQSYTPSSKLFLRALCTGSCDLVNLPGDHDQGGSCGSCVAFAVSAAAESAVAARLGRSAASIGRLSARYLFFCTDVSSACAVIWPAARIMCESTGYFCIAVVADERSRSQGWRTSTVWCSQWLAAAVLHAKAAPPCCLQIHFFQVQAFRCCRSPLHRHYISPTAACAAAAAVHGSRVPRCQHATEAWSSQRHWLL
jgi:hypothetical protein